jgi:hypothetical protein
MKEPKAILIIGNPIDGWKYIGPFKTEGDALQHPATEVDGWTWWVAELKDPVKYAEKAKKEIG